MDCALGCLLISLCIGELYIYREREREKSGLIHLEATTVQKCDRVLEGPVSFCCGSHGLDEIRTSQLILLASVVKTNSTAQCK